MDSVDLIAALVATMCNLSSPGLSKNVKMDCIEQMTNCLVIKDGQTNQKRIEYCREKYNKKD